MMGVILWGIIFYAGYDIAPSVTLAVATVWILTALGAV